MSVVRAPSAANDQCIFTLRICANGARALRIQHSNVSQSESFHQLWKTVRACLSLCIDRKRPSETYSIPIECSHLQHFAEETQLAARPTIFYSSIPNHHVTRHSDTECPINGGNSSGRKLFDLCSSSSRCT